MRFFVYAEVLFFDLREDVELAAIADEAPVYLGIGEDNLASGAKFVTQKNVAFDNRARAIERRSNAAGFSSFSRNQVIFEAPGPAIELPVYLGIGEDNLAGGAKFVTQKNVVFDNRAPAIERRSNFGGFSSFYRNRGIVEDPGLAIEVAGNGSASETDASTRHERLS